MSDARELAAQWKDRADDCGRLARSVLGSELAAARASSPPAWRKEPPTVEEIDAGTTWWWMRALGQPPEVFHVRVMYDEMQYLDVDGWHRGVELRKHAPEWSPCLPPGASPPAPGLVEAARNLAAISVSDHVYEGLCPDELQPDARDPACPMCRVVDAIAALRAALPKETP